MEIAFSLGTNMGDRTANLRDACTRLAALPATTITARKDRHLMNAASRAHLCQLAFATIGGDGQLRSGRTHPGNIARHGPPKQGQTRDIHLVRHRSRRSNALAL